ncbi:MAG: SpoVT / AbrB like domain protein [Candidatus Bathyarchaeota archaeon BA1]|nr:MAG: SpoVT / AbrB like domain protein [Candidatus Bathyarchaeota archaeon BA1]
MVKTIEMDKSGRVVIPREIRQALKISGEQTLLIELQKEEIVLKPLRLKSDPIKAIAEMNLPIAKWEEIEKQIEEGLLQE